MRSFNNNGGYNMKILSVFLLLVFCTITFSQEQYIELLRQDLRTEKVAIITEVMEFSEEQAKIFWPVYREYEHELSKIADKRIAIIKDYAENFENITDEKAKNLMERSFKFQEDRIKLRKKYFKKMDKILPTKIVAKFFQLENQIGLLVDLQIADHLPLIDEWLD
jgi:Na+/phosphate symporter